ncbi:MAG: hypothetical protein GXC73_13985 [Chitinophagaceae bacterium]|nr:hypothetical protein [Chitinophagaceae bacterium]
MSIFSRLDAFSQKSFKSVESECIKQPFFLRLAASVSAILAANAMAAGIWDLFSNSQGFFYSFLGTGG